MDRFATFHIADPREQRGYDDYPHAERYGNRIANGRFLVDRFSVSPYRNGDVDERQIAVVDVVPAEAVVVP